MRNHRRRRSSPIYTFLAVWLIFALMGVRMDHLAGLLITLGVGIIAGVGVSALLKRRDKKADEKGAKDAEAAAKAWEAEQAKAAKAEEKSPYSPEVQAIISEGRTALKEMGRLYKSIPDPTIREKINELMAVSDKIVRDAIDDPGDVPQIRKFLDYYLPTTIKLLNAYDRMSAQDIQGENISGSMERIEDMLDTTIDAYKKQLDALFANQAADIQMDIEIMNGMLAREGLGGKSYLDWNDFMKQYEKQQEKQQKEQINEQKGSTSNG
ncbi:MAG: 5-bromo-4-chloroindolyl phosphate hydrolysis family protein [Oscillospiraceae bacterium]|nr:5-bromo-4-chloroindolyl phosphate hydrolysis family protein [Oscillospiraceae bacterium]